MSEPRQLFDLSFFDITRDLLNELDAIAEEHGELTDTMVRENLFDSVYLSVLRPRPGYQLPDKYGLFQDSGHQRVKAALAEFARLGDTLARQDGLITPAQRLEAFQAVTSDAGSSTDEYFGWLDPEELSDD